MLTIYKSEFSKNNPARNFSGVVYTPDGQPKAYTYWLKGRIEVYAPTRESLDPIIAAQTLNEYEAAHQLLGC